MHKQLWRHCCSRLQSIYSSDFSVFALIFSLSLTLLLLEFVNPCFLQFCLSALSIPDLDIDFSSCPGVQAEQAQGGTTVLHLA